METGNVRRLEMVSRAGLKNIPETWDVGSFQDSKGKRLYEMPFNGEIVLVETTWYMLPG